MARKLTRVVKKVVRVGKRVAKKVMGTKAFGCLDKAATGAAHMLLDPCNAELVPSVYKGDQGYKTRLVGNHTIGNSNTTACAIVWAPGSNVIYGVEAVGAASTISWVVGSAPAPGTAFLATNADAMRCLGACVSAYPVASTMNISGFCFTGLMPLRAVTDCTTIDAVTNLCNRSGRVQIAEPMETKFVPGLVDEGYIAPSGQVSQDTDDSMCIVMAFVGLPANTGIRLRFTTIVEWKPNPLLGIATESHLSTPSTNTLEHVKKCLHDADTHWFSNVGKVAKSTLNGYVKGGVAGAVFGGLSALQL